MTLRARDLVGGYRPGDPVVQGVSLEVGPAQVLAIVGPSGSGKTTLLRMLAGLHRAESGTLELDGDEITAAPAHTRRIGIVPQEGALFPRLSVARNIGYGIRGLRGRRAAADPRVQELLELVGLADLAHRRPSELSGGQRQRVALARALAPRPRAVLLDEPFNALDTRLREQVREDVAGLLRTAGVATILITHDREEAFGVADQVAIFDTGRILRTAAPDMLIRDPGSLQVARATGDVVLLPATTEADGGHARTPLGRVRLGSVENGPVDRVALRPEQIRLHPVHAAGHAGTRLHLAAADPEAQAEVEVLTRRQQGPQWVVTVRASDGTTLDVRQSVFDPVSEPGSRVRVELLGASLLGLSPVSGSGVVPVTA